MREDLTYIVGVLDRSGSMEKIRNDVIGGINAFVESQKQGVGECLFTLIQFDNVNPQEYVYNQLNVKEIPPLTERTYVPRGGTPLLDALGNAITNTGRKLASIPEDSRPGKVIFVVITDGYENASTHYKKQQIADMVKLQQETYNWNFVFIGADIDAMAEAGALGFAMANTVNIRGQNVGATMDSTSDHINTYRKTGTSSSMGYTVSEREDFVKDKTDK